MFAALQQISLSCLHENITRRRRISLRKAEYNRHNVAISSSLWDDFLFEFANIFPLGAHTAARAGIELKCKFMKIILVGAAGRMGETVAKELALLGHEIAAAVDKLSPRLACPCYGDLSDVTEDADAVLDFSHHSSAYALAKFAARRSLPLVIATTGHDSDERQAIEDAAKRVPVFFCSNMSFGVSLFASLVGKVAAAFPYADVEIIETHRAMKADVPSGTALMLADTIDRARGGGSSLVVGRREGSRKGREIAISSLRLGDRVGEHEVIFDTGFQLITLRHEAFSRTLYARGAINALNFILDKPAGLYGINDIMAFRGQ